MRRVGDVFESRGIRSCEYRSRADEESAEEEEEKMLQQFHQCKLADVNEIFVVVVRPMGGVVESMPNSFVDVFSQGHGRLQIRESFFESSWFETGCNHAKMVDDGFKEIFFSCSDGLVLNGCVGSINDPFEMVFFVKDPSLLVVEMLMIVVWLK